MVIGWGIKTNFYHCAPFAVDSAKRVFWIQTAHQLVMRVWKGTQAEDVKGMKEYDIHLNDVTKVG